MSTAQFFVRAASGRLRVCVASLPSPPSHRVAMPRAVDAAHEAGIQVIYIRVELRPGHVGVAASVAH